MKCRLVSSNLLGVVFAGALVGCSSTVHYTNNPSTNSGVIVPVCVDQAYSTTEQNILSHSVSEWNHTMNGSYILIISGTCKNSDITGQKGIVFIRSHRGDPMIMASHEEHAVAVTYPWGVRAPDSIIYIVADNDQINLHDTALHELGHAFRAEHIDNTLMQLNYNRSANCIDMQTAKQVATHMHLDPGRLNYCN